MVMSNVFAKTAGHKEEPRTKIIRGSLFVD